MTKEGNSHDKESFGQRFARLRKEKGLTQESLAKTLGVSSQAVSKWETDASMPDIALLSPLSDALGVSIDELLGKEEETVKVLPNPTPEELDKKVFRIKIISEDGDVVKVNLPLGLVRIMVESGEEVTISGNASLKNIDWKKIFALVDKGMIGDLVDIESEDGDIVSISVN
jgi:transcriptional regulator with XRE-family HTH domain